MDVLEIKAKKTALETEIHRLLQDFISETGCRPCIHVGVDTIEHIGGQRVYIPKVEVDVVL